MTININQIKNQQAYSTSAKPSFKALMKASQINCGQFDEFRKLHANSITKTVLGEKFAKELNLDGISRDFTVFFNIYGSGRVHLMLMPVKNGLHNFVKTMKDNFNSTRRNVSRMPRLLNRAFGSDKLYLFESGASASQAINNSKGIIPAHLHYVLGRDISPEEIKKVFSRLSEREVLSFKNISLINLYKRLNELSEQGNLGYKLIAKQSDKYSYDAWAIIENNPQIPSKSLLISKVFSQLLNNSTNPQFYNWKIIDTDPQNWSQIMRSRIYSNRLSNNSFYNRLRNQGLINHDRSLVN